jgi:carbon monoxide dehydrogenase subunit G
MEISGSYTLYAPRERVWAFLLDPVRLASVIPGCEQMEQLGENHYRMRVSVGIAAVKGAYTGTLRVFDLREPESYSLAAEGSGARGVLQGEGAVSLEARSPTTTIVTYEGQGQLGGPIASIGNRIAQNAARMLINQFFGRVADALAQDMGTGTVASEVSETGSRPIAAQVAPLSTTATALPEWSGGIPEARPLESEALPTEARPLEPVTPLTGSGQPQPAANAPRTGRPAVPNPAPAFVTEFVRRTGLSDGTVESEQKTAWQLILIAAGAVMGTLLAALAGLLAARSRDD